MSVAGTPKNILENRSLAGGLLSLLTSSYVPLGDSDRLTQADDQAKQTSAFDS